MLALFIIAIALQHTTAPARHGFNGINLTDVQRATGNATYSMEENTSMSSGPSMLSEGIKKIYSSGFSTSKNLSQDSTIPQTISASVFFMSSQNAANALTYSLVASDSLVNGNAGTGEGSPTYNYTYMNDTVQIFLPFDIIVYNATYTSPNFQGPAIQYSHSAIFTQNGIVAYVYTVGNPHLSASSALNLSETLFREIIDSGRP